MKKITAVAVLALLTLPAWAQENGKPEVDRPSDPPRLGLHKPRNPNASPFGGGGGRSPNLTYHNGPILTTTAVRPIFWGTKWADNSYVGDKISGIDKFYMGVGGTDYAKTNTEYASTTSQVTATVTTDTALVDSSVGPTKAPATSTILSEVCKMIGTPATNGYYPVYTDLKRGNAGYCAWHSWGTCGGTNVQFAFFFDLAGDPGCDPQDSVSDAGRTYKPSQGLAALVNVSGHELSEAMTDPRGNAWYDNSGYENSDKCAWDFGTNYLTFPNGGQWKIQGNWSNAAYNSTDRGYSNEKGQKGCIDGGNYK